MRDRSTQIMRSEMEGLVELREREAELSKCRGKGLPVRGPSERLLRARANLRRVLLAREAACQPRARTLERWWRAPSSSRAAAPRQARACVDTLTLCRIYGTDVPSRIVRTLRDVERILLVASSRAPSLAEQRTGRGVAPCQYVPEFATLQNLRVREHAALSLLIRWILNARPAAKQIRAATRRFGVEHADKLCSFASRLQP